MRRQRPTPYGSGPRRGDQSDQSVDAALEQALASTVHAHPAGGGLARNGGPALKFGRTFDMAQCSHWPHRSVKGQQLQRRKTMKAVIITTLGLLLSSGLAYAADNPPLQGTPSGPTSGHPTVLTDTECNGVWMDACL